MAESNKELATAPYASWTTFVRFLEHLAENGVPQQIDRTVWPKCPVRPRATYGWR